MDETRIRAIADEVMKKLAEPDAKDLETRVERLEAAVTSHPSLRLLEISGSTDGRCILEPSKPCVASGQCRTLGH